MTLLDRVAGAPISWGVVEPPGWGHQLDPETVLSEMAGLGLRATELGPTGYLGADPEQVRGILGRHGLRLVGGFLPAVLHTSVLDVDGVASAVQMLAAGGGDVVVLAAASADGSYERKVSLDQAEWARLIKHLAQAETIVRDHGMLPVFHPHVGTAIEIAAAVEQLLATTDVSLCLDTGHLMIGGTDSLALVRRSPERVAHVHLKDVRAAVAEKVAAHTLGYADAVREGLYTPLGAGDVDIAAIIAALEGAGYRGWYVLEQDTVVPVPPPPGSGPVENVRRSLDFLRLSLEGV